MEVLVKINIPDDGNCRKCKSWFAVDETACIQAHSFCRAFNDYGEYNHNGPRSKKCRKHIIENGGCTCSTIDRIKDKGCGNKHCLGLVKKVREEELKLIPMFLENCKIIIQKEGACLWGTCEKCPFDERYNIGLDCKTVYKFEGYQAYENKRRVKLAEEFIHYFEKLHNQGTENGI